VLLCTYVMHPDTSHSVSASCSKICTPYYLAHVHHVWLQSTDPLFYPICVMVAINASKAISQQEDHEVLHFRRSLHSSSADSRYFSLHRRKYCILHVLPHPCFDERNKEHCLISRLFQKTVANLYSFTHWAWKSSHRKKGKKCGVLFAASFRIIDLTLPRPNPQGYKSALQQQLPFTPRPDSQSYHGIKQLLPKA
jgi:hypothetical protein